MQRRELLLGGLAALTTVRASRLGAAPKEAAKRFLYAAEPGIRNYTDLGGVGVLVFDIDAGYRFVKRIPTFEEREGVAAENVKGIAACAKTARLYVSTIKRLACIDLVTDKMLWNREYEGGCDRMAIARDGRNLYVPSFEGPFWNVVAGATGNPLGRIEPNSGAHNTIYGPAGSRVYLAGLKSPWLSVADAHAHKVTTQVGPFGNSIRPFTITGDEARCFVNVNDLLGFEIGDLRTREKTHRVEVQGFERGPVKRHGCPSHGIGLTPDGKELWLADGFNEHMHIFDATQMPPRQVASIKLRDQPGWVTFSIDGKHAWPSTGEVIDVNTRKIVVSLADEKGRQVHSEKVLEIDFENGKPIRNGDQFGISRA